MSLEANNGGVMQSGLQRTERGFDVITFFDRNSVECSLQKPSIATDDFVWLGVDDAYPQILGRDVREGLTGWVKYPVPEGVLFRTRMHLSRAQVRALLPYLTRFVETGEIR